MTLAEWAPWIGAALGAGGLSGGVLALVKARPEAKRIDADAAKVIQDASAAWVQGVSHDLQELRGKVAALERERREREQRDELQDRRLRVHERWDRNVAEQMRELGAHVSDPPPLYPDPMTA